MIPLLIGTVCGLAMVIISLGTFRRWPKMKRTPPVTVVVCARDEERNLFECLMSLATQDYPEDRYRLVLVDHLSRDRSGEIMDTFAESCPIQTTVLHIREPHPVYSGKIHALVEAMKHVDTEHVLMTDADCIVPESWIRSLVGCFSEHVAAVGGLVTVEPDSDHKSNWVAHLQNVDHRYYMGLVGGLSGLAGFYLDRKRKQGPTTTLERAFMPTFVSGNNMGFSLSAYKTAGGYEAMAPSFIEDFALLTDMVRKTGGVLAFSLEPDACVQTRPLPTLRSLWRQKRRWATATATPHALSYLLYGFVFSSRVVLPWFIFFQPLETLVGLLLTGFGSAVVLMRVNKMMESKVRVRDIVFHEIYQIVLNHGLLLATLLRWPVIWKGDRHRLPRA